MFIWRKTMVSTPCCPRLIGLRGSLEYLGKSDLDVTYCPVFSYLFLIFEFSDVASLGRILTAGRFLVGVSLFLFYL